MKIVCALIILCLDLCSGQLDAGHVYAVKNKRSNLYLNVVSYSVQPSELLEQWNLQPTTSSNRASQLWHVFPVDNNLYLIVNYRSGLPMNVYYNSLSVGTAVEQYKFQTSPSASQTWLLKPEDTFNRVINARSKLYLGVKGFSTSLSARVEQQAVDVGQSGSQQWKFVLDKTYGQVVQTSGQGTAGVDDIGGINQITSVGQSPNRVTPPVLVGIVVIPFPLITDGTKTAPEQSTKSAYYILRRYGYWEMTSFHYHTGLSAETLTQTVTVGLSSGDDATIQRVAGIHVTDSATFGVTEVLNRLYGVKLANGLKIKVTEGVTGPSGASKKIDRMYVAGSEFSEALWFRADRWVLRRLDGTMVYQWTTRDPVKMVVDRFPKPK